MTDSLLIERIKNRLNVYKIKADISCSETCSRIISNISVYSDNPVEHTQSLPTARAFYEGPVLQNMISQTFKGLFLQQSIAY